MCGKYFFCTNTYVNAQNKKDEFVKVYDISSEVTAERFKVLEK